VCGEVAPPSMSMVETYRAERIALPLQSAFQVGEHGACVGHSRTVCRQRPPRPPVSVYSSGTSGDCCSHSLLWRFCQWTPRVFGLDPRPVSWVLLYRLQATDADAVCGCASFCRGTIRRPLPRWLSPLLWAMPFVALVSVEACSSVFYAFASLCG
jgi:hypothetical protein